MTEKLSRKDRKTLKEIDQEIEQLKDGLKNHSILNVGKAKQRLSSLYYKRYALEHGREHKIRAQKVEDIWMGVTAYFAPDGKRWPK